MAKRTLRIEVLGRIWSIEVLEADAFSKRFEGEYEGVTIPGTAEIVINDADLNFVTVAHEIHHAAFAGLCMSSADLTPAQLEEVTADLFAIHGEKLIALAKQVFKELKSQ